MALRFPIRSSASSSGTSKGSDRREHARSDVSGIWCDRGEVLDISARGMRLTSLRRWGEGQVRRLSLTDGKRSVTLTARCVWCRQEGMFSHSMGLAFEPANVDEERALAAMASDHSVANSD